MTASAYDWVVEGNTFGRPAWSPTQPLIAHVSFELRARTGKFPLFRGNIYDASSRHDALWLLWNPAMRKRGCLDFERYDFDVWRDRGVEFQVEGLPFRPDFEAGSKIVVK